VPRPYVVLAVLVLVVLAGCSGFGGVTTTREPFGVADPPTATSADDDGRVDPPPAIGFDPLHDTAPDPFNLTEAHQRTLSGRPYTVTYTYTETYVNGTPRVTDRWTTTFGPSRSTYLQNRTSSLRDDVLKRQVYANGTHVWGRTIDPRTGNESVRLLRAADGTSLDPVAATVRGAPTAIRTGLVAMQVTDVTKLDTVPSGVEEPLFRVIGTETRTPNPFGDRTLNASFTLIVTEDGRIIEYVLERTYVANGVTLHAITRVQYSHVDTATVDRPTWVPANASTTIDAGTIQDHTPSVVNIDDSTIHALPYPDPIYPQATAASSIPRHLRQ
jgi:hypothetical protein